MKKNNLLKTFILLLCILVIYLRLPSLFIEPRFWAEEGAVYFSYAFSHPWYESLLACHQGYYSLFSNFATTLAANFVSLKYAPFVTTYFAFIIQMIPLGIILWGKSSLWNTLVKKIIVILIIFFAPLSGEVWLNTINSQFYFSLITFLILMDDETENKIINWCYRILLIFSGLTGPVSSFLAPIFIFKAWDKKKKEPIAQAGILLLCIIVQILAVMLSIKSNPEISTRRFNNINPPNILSIMFTRTIALPLFGHSIANFFAKVFYKIHLFGYMEFNVLGVILFFLLAMFFRFIYRSVEPKRQMMILGSYFLITVLSIISSTGNKGVFFDIETCQRYIYVPNILMMLFIFSNIPFENVKDILRINQSRVCIALLMASLFLGGIVYKASMKNYTSTDWKNYASTDWPKWSVEVTKWEHDQNYRLKIWPQWEKMQWTVKLEHASR